MPLIKIKVKHGEHNKIINLERTLPNPYGVFWGELIKKFNDADIDVYYEGKTKILINDDESLKAAIDDCIASKQAFLQLVAQDKPDQEEQPPQPVQQPVQSKPAEQPKPAPTQSKPAEQPKPAPAQSKPAEQPMSPANSVPASPSKPKFCSQCGAKLGNGKFCAECGAPVAGGAPTQTTPSQPAAQQNVEKEPDFDPKFACGKCGKMVVSGGVKALNKLWHTGCFTCKVCGCNFDQNHQLMEDDGKPICSKCYEETCAPRCFKCNNPLTGRYIEVNGHSYHPDCFVCSRCGKPFEGGQYLVVDGKPTCKKCV